MQFSTLALSALLSLASAQKTTVVTVGMNGTLTYSPNNIKVAVGEMVQFQFVAGNHTATQSTFANPCQPISMNSNATGFHSGFQPAAASASQNQVSTYSIMVTDSKPIWVYCAQGTHCEKGMAMVINENVTVDTSKSLTNYQAAAAKAQTIVPNTTSGGTSSTTSGSGSTSSSTVPGAAGILHVPSTLGLLGLVAALMTL